MNAKKLTSILVVFAVLLVTNISEGRPSRPGNKSSGHGAKSSCAPVRNSGHGRPSSSISNCSTSSRSHRNNSGFSITWNSGNSHFGVNSRQSCYPRHSGIYNHRYPRGCWPVIKSYPKRFPLGPVIVYGPSRERTVIHEKVIVVITNDNGSQTPVELTRIDGQGYKGPKGEYYSQMPSEGQLRALYGTRSQISSIYELNKAASTVTVWLDNENGSKTPVQLVKAGRSYIGPMGEHYTSMPSKTQLREMYGLNNTAVPLDSVTIILQNSDGTTTPIVLVEDGENFVGPNGEYYAGMPTQTQLATIYGK